MDTSVLINLLTKNEKNLRCPNVKVLRRRTINYILLMIKKPQEQKIIIVVILIINSIPELCPAHVNVDHEDLPDRRAGRLLVDINENIMMVDDKEVAI